MKLTDNKRQWVKERVIKYCKEMECDVPNWLFLTNKDWNEWKEYNKEMYGIKKFRSPNGYLGLCNKHTKVIAIFVKKFATLKRLDQTIRHELAHWVRSYNHRTKKFEVIMNKIKNGTIKA